jgi:drug/metabolite transporter (DMT)-like permease
VIAKATGPMERSAINSYTAAGAFLGLILGLNVGNMLVQPQEPGFLFTVAGLIAMLPTVAIYVLVSRRFRRARPPERMFLAISGWFVLAGSMAALIVATHAIFPNAVAT